MLSMNPFDSDAYECKAAPDVETLSPYPAACFTLPLPPCLQEVPTKALTDQNPGLALYWWHALNPLSLPQHKKEAPGIGEKSGALILPLHVGPPIPPEDTSSSGRSSTNISPYSWWYPLNPSTDRSLESSTSSRSSRTESLSSGSESENSGPQSRF